jgi:stage II sporulation protein D
MRRFAIAAAAALAAVAAPPGPASAYTIHGRAFGHGIGMSQWGAFGFAKHGRAYDQILRHYYKGTDLHRITPHHIRVLLETGEAQVAFAGASFAADRPLHGDRTYRATLRSDGRIVVRGSDGKRVGTFTPPLRVLPANNALRIGGTALNGVTDGAYRGSLELVPTSGGGGLTAINELSLEGYVRGVVPGEVPSSWPAEALKAQAVAARSYALTTDAGGSLFDQYPDTRSQVYKGLDGEQPRTSGAVKATSTQVVRYQGKTAVTYFFSSSGGRTENIENAFYGSSPTPYLRSVRDPYDYYAPRHNWRIEYSLAEVRSRLHGLIKGSFRGVRAVERGVSPRIVSADVVGTGGSTRVSGATLKSRFGLYDSWAYFPSFGTSRERAVAAQPLPLPIALGRSAASSRPAPRPAGFGWPADAWRARAG